MQVFFAVAPLALRCGQTVKSVEQGEAIRVIRMRISTRGRIQAALNVLRDLADLLVEP
jgi:hypothetical protein